MDTVAERFRAGSTVSIANPGLRAYMLRNSAQHLVERYDGSMLNSLAASDRWLDNVQRNGLIQRLAEFPRHLVLLKQLALAVSKSSSSTIVTILSTNSREFSKPHSAVS